ncbi:MAG: 4Fe-4S binding protein [Bacillota bacterium]
MDSEERVSFNADRCKGCGLCVDACPKGIIVLAERINSKGFPPAVCTDQAECTSCASCARMCPDMVITVRKGE